MSKKLDQILLFTFLFLFKFNQADNNSQKDIDTGFNKDELEQMQQDTQQNYYEMMIDKREKEIENERMKQEGINKQELQQSLNIEKQSWLYKNKKQLLKLLGIGVSTIIIIMIGWKLYIMNQNIEEQNTNIREKAKQMENIIEDTDNLVFVSWKDQKEGIVFLDNPAYKQKIEKDLSKQERLLQEIKQLQKEKIQRDKEIQKLKQKGQNYEDEIENLKEQYEENKKRVLDEGCALGYAKPVLREFK